MESLRVAIVAGLYYRPQGTQVNFHIANLFGGNTVILSGARADPCPLGRPAFYYKEPGQGPSRVADRVREGVESLGNLIRYSTNKVPRGKARREMLRFLRDEKVDVILSEFGSIAPRLQPIAAAAGVPMFTYFRGIDASAHLRNPLRLSSYRRAVPHMAGIFAVSQSLLDNLAAKGVTHPHSFVVPSGVNTDLFRPGRKVPLSCLAVGRLIPKKRPDITIRAFLKATEALPEARLEIVGGGKLEEECRAIVAASETPEKVILHGAKPHDFVRERLAECAVFLQHSVVGPNGDTEGLPTSIQEAMACGGIVVSTRHAGIPEAVEEGRTGYLVNEGDEASFAVAIEHALNLSPEERMAMASAARQTAEERLDNRTLVGLVEAKMLELVGTVREG